MEALLKISSRSTSGKLSRLYQSFKSPPGGVLEDRDDPDGGGDGVKVVKISQESFTESFIKIQHQEGCQDSTYSSSPLLESWLTGMFLMEVEMLSK